MGVSSTSTDFYRAGSFQELTRLVEGLDLESVLEEPVSTFLGSLASGAAKQAVEEMARTGELRTFRDALRNAHLRAEVRWRGGRPGEISLLRALQDWLAHARPTPRAAPPPPEVEPTAPTPRPSGLYLGITPEDLEVWAREHDVSALLSLTDLHLAHVLEGRARYWLTASANGRTVAELMAGGEDPSRSSRRWGRGASPEVQGALIQLLEAAAEEARAGIAEEQERALAELRPTGDPGLSEVWDSLMEERARHRASAPPPPRARREGWALSVSEDPPVVSVQTTGYALCGRTPAPKIQISLQRAGDAPAAACTCRHPEACCGLKLAAVDLCLETLRDPATVTQARAMTRARGRPAWERLLGRIDPLLVEPELKDKSGNALTLGWRLRWKQRDAALEPVGCRPRRSGKGTTITRLDLAQIRSQPGLLGPTDSRVAILLNPDPAARSSSSFTDNARILRAMLELCGHPRVFLGESTDPVAVRRDTLTLKWTQTPEGGVTLSLVAGARSWTPGELLVQFREEGAGELMMLREPDRLTLIEVPLTARSLIRELSERGDTLPAEATDALLRRLPAIARLLPCQLDPALRGTPVGASLRPLVFLELEPGDALLVEVRLRPLADGPSFTPGEGAVEVHAHRAEGRVFTTRDRAAEPALVQAALASVPLPLESESAPFQWVLSRPEEALPVIEALQALGEAVHVIWRGERKRKVSSQTGQLGVSVGTRRDWLGLSGALQIDGASIPLDRLLAAIRAGAHYIDVDGETWLKLSAPFRTSLTPLAVAVQETRAAVELSSLHAGLLEALEDAGALVEGPEGWRDLCRRVREAQQLELEPPPELQANLRDYQRQGFAWMTRLAAWSTGGVLADDMGLGKTVQALAFLLRRRAEGPALVIAPTSVCFNWQREAARWAPSLRTRAYRGAGRERTLEDLGEGDLLVASYDILARDAAVLARVPFGTLILDEAQAIKNPHTRRSRAVFGLDAAFRLGLTGTPVENRLSELWSLFRAVTPGLFGSWERFRDRFVFPIERDDDRDRRQALARLIRPFLLRRLKRQVASELPPRTEVQIDVTLSRDERVLYDQIRRQALQEIGAAAAGPEAQQRMRVLAALTRLRQAALHPRLISPELTFPSAKLERLREILLELRAEGHRALIFSQFVRLLALTREALQADGFRFRWLDGATPEKQRREEVDAFQRGEGDAFLISLKAGGTGLNLTAATYVIHLDPWWNPAVEDQATDRAHRIGQEQPVTVIRLVARGTLEETILAMHAEKRALANDLLEGSGASATLGADDLIALIAEGADGLEPPDPEDEPAPEPEGITVEGADIIDLAEPPPREPDLPSAGSSETQSLDDQLLTFETFLGEEVADQRLSRRLASQYMAAMSEYANWLAGEGQTRPSLLELERQQSSFLRAALSRPLPRHRRVADVFGSALGLFISFGQAEGWE